MNAYGQQRRPFLFLIDYEMKRPVIHALDELPDDIAYSIGSNEVDYISSEISITSFPESLDTYRAKFDIVQAALGKGESYLLNLTCQTPIIISGDLHELYQGTTAKYKLKYKDEFVCFSPESFVRIDDNTIRSFPMKGTMNADIPHARALLQNNKKELAEHYTIVDLIRNDLSRVATNVTVDRFRYTERIDTPSGGILQQSTEISGDLDITWKDRIGDIFGKLLPAGSISGAPKRRTVEIIHQAEGIDRGYYTGIFGIFDGRSLDSGVLIRYIEKSANQYYFRSGGGITYQSDAMDEYQEMINKIYVPTLRKHTDTRSADSPVALSHC